MTWYAVFRTSTGELLSLTTTEPTGLAADLSYVALPSGPDPSLLWDEAGKTWKPRPADVLLDRIADLTNDPALGAVWTRLTATQAAALRDRLGKLLGAARFRRSNEPVDLDIPAP